MKVEFNGANRSSEGGFCSGPERLSVTTPRDKKALIYGADRKLIRRYSRGIRVAAIRLVAGSFATEQVANDRAGEGGRD